MNGLSIAPPEPWTEQADCASVDPDLWWPEKGGSTRAAQKICRGCPVIAECLQYALDHGERAGVWGGTTERQRRRMPSSKRVHSANWARGDYQCTRCPEVFANRHGQLMHERTHLAVA